MTIRAASIVFVTAMLLVAVAAKESAPPPADDPTTAVSSTTERARPERPLRGRRSIESLSPEEIGEVIAVAADISPEWGASLRARQSRDPDGLRTAISDAGPRLVSLAVLRRSHPDLYSIRVEDLRIQNELKTLASEYRATLESGGVRAAQLEAELRRKVERQVDLDLRASAMELQALDEQVKRMVEQLRSESQQRGVRVDQVLEEIKAGGEPKPMVRPWRTGAGERGSRRSG